MTTDLKPVTTRSGLTYLAEFFGGAAAGVCLQLTPDTRSYITLTREQALDLSSRLRSWAIRQTPPEHVPLPDLPPEPPEIDTLPDPGTMWKHAASQRQEEPKTLYDQVRHQIGLEGPQLRTQDYEDRIDTMLDNMSAKDLLNILSYTFDWTNLKQS